MLDRRSRHLFALLLSEAGPVGGAAADACRHRGYRVRDAEDVLQHPQESETWSMTRSGVTDYSSVLPR